MPNGGSDNCVGCPFKTINDRHLQYPDFGRIEEWDRDWQSKNFFCQIRQIKIDAPPVTFCDNYPTRNPLWKRNPRGPMWTMVSSSLDSKSTSERIPDVLLPRHIALGFVRIPYYNNIRPTKVDGQTAKADYCHLCQDEFSEGISLHLPESGNRFFCSVAHYVEWWFDTSPEAAPYHHKAPLDAVALAAQIETLHNKLPSKQIGTSSSANTEALEILNELDDLLADLGYAQIDIWDAENLIRRGKSLDWTSLHLLRAYSNLARAGDLFRQEQPDPKALRACIADIQDNLLRFLES